MARVVAIFLILIFLIPLAYSISIKELIARYIFSTSTPDMDITSNVDFMIDKNDNNINDTLVIELTTSNANGNFIFVINLLDKNGILTNETNKTLSSGENKLNITFDSVLLSQNEFNYSIKVYNSSYSLKYRKDNILTQNYQSYEGGFSLLDIRDSKIDKNLVINITLNSSINGNFESIIFISYNDSVISAKETKSIINSTQDLIFTFYNETIKRTHHIGNFNISSIKIGRKTIKTDSTTPSYDFKDFAVKSYIIDFTDNGMDLDNDDKFDNLQINANVQILNDNTYTIKLAMYDLFDDIIEIKNITTFLNSGNNIITFNLNGSRIYDKKLNGPFVVKYIELYENGTLIDNINDAYITKNYNFNDFDVPNLPDLDIDIFVYDGRNYGMNNAEINVSVKNIGNKHAFNVFVDIFDNSTFTLTNKSNILYTNSSILYQISFTNMSDFELTAIADLQNFVEELNESNNAERITIKLNEEENDMDKDGINDNIDPLIGNASSVNTSTINLRITIDNSANLSSFFDGNQRVRFFDNNLIITQFNFNFSKYKLNLTNLTIDKQLPNESRGSLLIKGLKMPQGRKVMYVDRVNASINSICIKDLPISSINDISPQCRARGEVKVNCSIAQNASSICIYIQSINKFGVNGLRHSGIVQIKI